MSIKSFYKWVDSIKGDFREGDFGRLFFDGLTFYFLMYNFKLEVYHTAEEQIKRRAEIKKLEEGHELH